MLRPASDTKKDSFVTILAREGCPFCKKAKQLLSDSELFYEEIKLGPSLTIKSVKNVTGKSTVPQIYIDGQHIGGSDDLEIYLKNRK